MELKLLKLQLIYYNYSSKTLFIKIFFIATVMALVPCLNLVYPIDIGYDYYQSTSWTFQKAKVRMTIADLDAAFQLLMRSNWLDTGHKSLLIGRDSARAVMVIRKLGLSDSIGVDRKPCSSLVTKGDLYRLPFKPGKFDFVFSTATFDEIRIPAKMVLEMERVLKPGRVGVVLRRVSGGGRVPVVKAAAPVVSYLKMSEVVGVRTVNCTVMVVFRKKSVGGMSERWQRDDTTAIDSHRLSVKQVYV